MTDVYACPLCQQPLQRVYKTWRCLAGHSYDIAKQGYVNLLPSHHRNSKQPGDSVDMVLARQRFLNAGYYQPLRDQIVELAQAKASTADGLHLLDVGCGEGYYSHHLAQQMGATLFGLDISQQAIKKASSQYKDQQFCVASSINMPYVKNAFDLALTVFAPVSLTELQRVLADSGRWLRVTPSEKHLQEVREFLYAAPKSQADAPQKSYQGFALQQTKQLEFTVELSSPEAIKDLLFMTPFLHQGSSQGKDKLLSLSALTVTAHFEIQLFKKAEPA